MFKSLGILTISVVSMLGISTTPLTANAQVDLTHQQSSPKATAFIKLTGIVKDQKTNKSIPLANVQLLSAGKRITSATTNFDGKFIINNVDTIVNPLHNLQLVFSCVGCENDTISKVKIPIEFVGKDLVVDIATVVETAPRDCGNIGSIRGIIAIEPDEPSE